MRWNLVARNATELVTPPRKARHDFVTFTREQARCFLEAVKGDRLEALYILALTTGMRERELFGLRWGRCQPGRWRATPGQAAQDAILTPAGPARQRRGGRARTPPGQAARGAAPTWPGWGDHGLVFPNIVAKPLHPSNFLQRSFYPLLERAGLPRIRFHDLHHSAATLLLGLGIHPKLVSEMPGHSQIGITLDLYSHVTATMQQEAVRAFEGLFGSQVGSREGATEQENPSSRPCSSMDRATDF